MEELLERITSRELTEWEAYERFAGPIGSGWQDEVMAGIHEQLQRLNRIQGAAHFTDKKHRKNPVPEPKDYPRPYEIYKSLRGDNDDRYDAGTDELDDELIDTFGTSGEDEQDGDDH